MNKQLMTTTGMTLSFHYPLICGVITLCISSIASAQTEQSAAVNSIAEFDSSFLVGDAKKIDVKKFANGNPILPGEYNLDIYINGTWYGKRRIDFKATDDESNAYTCFTAKQLLEYGVKAQIVKEQLQVAQDNCQLINEWVEGAFYKFDSSRLRLDLSIPQVSMQQNARGYIDPSVWDRGINAAFASYNANAYKPLITRGVRIEQMPSYR